MSAQPKAVTPDYKVKDIKLAEWGRKEITLAEVEMPGLMASVRNTRPSSRSKARALPAACI
jgi:S-adenosylhomocysteine hydrolase